MLTNIINQTIKYLFKTFILIVALVLASNAFSNSLKVITIDYAYYNPVSLLMKDRKSLEKEFKKDQIKVRWVLSLGSNKALEYLNGGSVDFGSTAGAASVIGRANGIPIKAIYVYSKPEWTAPVTNKDSGITALLGCTCRTDVRLSLPVARERAHELWRRREALVAVHRHALEKVVIPLSASAAFSGSPTLLPGLAANDRLKCEAGGWVACRWQAGDMQMASR